MNATQANLLLVTAELMRRTGMRRQIVGVGHADERYASFLVSNGRGRPKSLILPNLVRGQTRISVLSLLEKTSISAMHWLCNGQAHTGTRQIVHFGDSGGCFLVLSRLAVEARYRALYEDRYDAEIAQEAWAQADLRNAPAHSKLFFRTPDDQDEVVQLAPEAVTMTLYRALTGEVQEITPSEVAALQPLLDTRSFGVELVDCGNERFLLGRPRDFENRQAA